eukprot:GGOE01010479.1.p1 GENE.GGOE01010479.1~~GGOE01010479.1.p1  ORF type:complete len:759 (-),score=197.21 GGOE01010479.1:1491-3599(-)
MEQELKEGLKVGSGSFRQKGPALPNPGVLKACNDEKLRWCSGLTGVMTRLSPGRSVRPDAAGQGSTSPSTSPPPDRLSPDCTRPPRLTPAGCTPPRSFSAKLLDKLGLSPRCADRSPTVPLTPPLAALTECTVAEARSGPSSPLSSSSSSLLTLAARVPSRSTEEEFACRDGNAFFIDSLVDGWDEATRKVDVSKVETYEDLFAEAIRTFPELEAHKSSSFLKVVQKDHRRPTELDPADLRDSSELHRLLLLIKPCRPVVPIMLTLDHGSPHPKFAELLYFCPDYQSLVQWVMQQFPITRRHLQALVWGGPGQTEVPLTEATDWKELRRLCRYVRVVTGFDPEDKHALLEEWRRSLQRVTSTTCVKRTVAIPTAVARDRVLGLIHGALLGAVMGAATNRMCSEDVHAVFKGDVAQLDVKTAWGRGASGTSPGDWPKSFDPFFLTMESLVRSGGEVCQRDMACTLARWLAKGLPEVAHRPPTKEGLDPTDRRVLEHSCFLRDPQFAADCVVQEFGVRTATNGVLVRALLLGCVSPENPETVRANTEQLVSMTHGHARCLVAALTIVSVVRQLLMMEAVDAELMSRISSECTVECEVDAAVLDRHLTSQSLDDLELDDSDDAASVYKAMGCGMWCLRSSSDFKTTIRTVVKEGGNAEVNAALAGALLGCRLGYSQLPKDWVGDLRHKSYVKSASKAFLRLLHLQ